MRQYRSIQVCGYTELWCEICAELIIHVLFCTGYPTAQGTEAQTCFGELFYVGCFHDYTTNNAVAWFGNGSGIGIGDQLYSMGGNILEVKNVTRDLFSNVVTTFQCAVVVNGTMISGDPYQMDPNGRV